MRCCIWLICCLLFGTARGFYKLDKYYQHVPPTRTSIYYHHTSGVTASPTKSSLPYQKYEWCTPRTFFFRDCTLCFCTDAPMVALCWDYEEERCQRIRELVDSQGENNDPQGVW